MFARGVFFEKIVRKTKFKDWNFTGYATDGLQGLNIPNFYLVDFFKNGVVASLKTTKVTDVKAWLNPNSALGRKNQNHILGLMDGIKNQKFTQLSNGGGKSLNNITKAELHIVVLDLGAIDKVEWTKAIKKIAKDEGYSDATIKNLKIEFATMEQILN